MSKAKFYESNGIKQVLFECPGCGYLHAVTIQAPSGPIWIFNNDLEKPTFSPSLLCNPDDPDKSRCHSFVTNGKIQFLGDCWHELKNQTVDLPEIDF